MNRWNPPHVEEHRARTRRGVAVKAQEREHRHAGDGAAHEKVAHAGPPRSWKLVVHDQDERLRRAVEGARRLPEPGHGPQAAGQREEDATLPCGGPGPVAQELEPDRWDEEVVEEALALGVAPPIEEQIPRTRTTQEASAQATRVEMRRAEARAGRVPSSPARSPTPGKSRPEEERRGANSARSRHRNTCSSAPPSFRNER